MRGEGLKKMTFYIITVALITAIGAICLILCSSEDRENIIFLEHYGWEVEKEYIERVELTIPKQFDEVYNNYNSLQNIAGLDLSKYKGKDAVRYTYKVKNFPNDTANEVRANVICVGGVPVGGDVMTVRLDGFMYSLNYLKSGQ